jgi:hypothetical protein
MQRDAAPSLEAAIYDFEREADGLAHGRRRAVADWGGDDLFTARVPRRRFNRHGALHAAAGELGGGSRPLHAAAGDFGGAGADRDAARRAATEAVRAAQAAGFADVAPRGRWVPAPLLPDADVESTVESGASHRSPSEPGSGARRTVAITGRPGTSIALRPRRPQRSLLERLSARPDRIAGWAVGLGSLLILIAVSTADAAPL